MAEDTRNYKAGMTSTETAQKGLAAAEAAWNKAKLERELAQEKLKVFFQGTDVDQDLYDNIMKTAIDNYIKAEGDMRTAEANLKQEIVKEDLLFEANKAIAMRQAYDAVLRKARDVTATPPVTHDNLVIMINGGYLNKPSGATVGRVENYPPDAVELITRERIAAVRNEVFGKYAAGVNLTNVEDAFRTLEGFVSNGILPADKETDILINLKEKMSQAAEQQIRTEMATTALDKVTRARSVYETRTHRLSADSVKRLSELVDSLSQKEKNDKHDLAKKELLRRMNPTTPTIDRFKDVKQYITDQLAAGDIDAAFAEELKELVTKTIDNLVTQYEADIRNGVIAGPDLETKIRNSIGAVERPLTYPPGDTEFANKLREKLKDLKTEETTNNESAEKFRKEKNSKTFRDGVVNAITKGAIPPAIGPEVPITINLDGPGGVAVSLTFANLTDMQLALNAQKTAGNIEDDNLTAESINTDISNNLKNRIKDEMARYTQTPAPGAAALPLGNMPDVITNLSAMSVRDLLPNSAVADLISEASKEHAALVKKYKDAAVEGVSRNDWQAMSVNIPARNEAELQLYLDAVAPEGVKFTKLVTAINGLIEKRDPQVVGTDGRPSIPFILDYARNHGKLNWMEEDAFVTGVAATGAIPPTPPLLEAYYTNYRLANTQELSLSSAEGIGGMQEEMRRILNRLTVPPLTAVQKMKIENDIKFALKDARLAERIAKWERARGKVNKMTAILSGFIVGTTIVTAAGIGLAVSPAALIIIAGLGIPGGVRYAAGLLDKIDRANRDMLALEQIPEDLRIKVAEAGQEINDMFKKPETFDAKKITDRITKLRQEINAVKIPKPENKNQRAA